MRILIIKTSSMGDVIHTLPAVTDLAQAYPNAKIDWVIEESFIELAQIHPAINKVIPVALRRWRRNLSLKILQEIKAFISNLREYKYDYVVDAQGLLKSSILTLLVKYNKTACAKSHGYDKYSVRGKYISWLYGKQYKIVKHQHAVYRLKQLFSAVFNYNYFEQIDYGINLDKYKSNQLFKPYLVFLHCTTWDSKKWPVEYWQELISIAKSKGYDVRLNSGSQNEFMQAREIASDSLDGVTVMEPQSISDLIQVIVNSSGVVCVDTGLGHLAAALNKPGVTLFGSTDAKLTGMLANNFSNLQAQYECSPCLLRECKFTKQELQLAPFAIFPPCYNELKPDMVWSHLEQYLF